MDKKAGIVSIESYGVSCFYNAVMKSVFSVYRPWIRSDKIKPLKEVMAGATGYSFPSGHSTSVSSFYSALMFYFRKYKKLCFIFAFMIFTTMFSRLYVGVHTSQDVLEVPINVIYFLLRASIPFIFMVLYPLTFSKND